MKVEPAQGVVGAVVHGAEAVVLQRHDPAAVPHHQRAEALHGHGAEGEFAAVDPGIQLAAHRAAVDRLAPGVPNREVHFTAARVITEGMKDLGLMKGDVKEAVAAGAHAMFFQCGLGHHMGLDVHDMEGLGEDYVGYTDTIKRNPMFGFRSLRLGRALEPGFVITVEPGLYFIPDLIDQWREAGQHSDFIVYENLDAWKDFGGVRIEDDVLVTEDGPEILTEPCAKSVEGVEAACQGR